MHRLGLQHRLSEIAVVDRHVAPAEEVEPLLLHRLRDDLLAHRPAAGVLRHEELADGVEARLRQRNAERGALLLEEAMRDLGEDAAAVAELGIGADGAAMVEIAQDLQALLDQPVALAVLHVGDEADAARVLLVARVVEPPARRQGGITHGRRKPVGRCAARLTVSAHRQPHLPVPSSFRQRARFVHTSPAPPPAPRPPSGQQQGWGQVGPVLFFRRFACAVPVAPASSAGAGLVARRACLRPPLYGRRAYAWLWRS